MFHGWTSAVAIAIAVVAVWLWERRRRRDQRDEDASDVAAQAAYDAWLFGAIALTVVLLAAALLLAGCRCGGRGVGGVRPRPRLRLHRVDVRRAVASSAPAAALKAATGRNGLT